MTHVDRLPCGCRPGTKRHCPVAIDLWGKAIEARRAAAGKSLMSPEAVEAAEALKRYNLHYHPPNPDFPTEAQIFKDPSLRRKLKNVQNKTKQEKDLYGHRKLRDSQTQPVQE
jgi:hypothetical protein